MSESFRIGDTERQRAMEELAQHYVEGRLNHDEYAERLDAAGTARTAPDLRALFSDLPQPANPLLSAQGRAASSPRVYRRRRTIPYVPALLLVAVIALLGDRDDAWWLVLVLVALAAILLMRRARQQPPRLEGPRHPRGGPPSQ